MNADNELDELSPAVNERAEGWQSSPQEIQVPGLPPADHGRDAWMALVACVIVQLPIWGNQAASARDG
jgi:hypothetical protein